MRKGRNTYKDINEQLIIDCRKGSRKAQTEVYRLYYKAMYNASLRIVGRTDIAEDIMQESFLKAFQNLDQFKAEVSFGAWLKRIVINRSLDFVRQESAVFEDISDMEIEASMEEEAEMSYSIEQVKNEINQLPDGYRIVLSLYLIEGYDHDEIAKILKISPSTSRSQYTRAKRKLAENLKKRK